MAKRKNMMDMTPVCERCGKVAPVDEKLSTPNWIVYRTKEPCECGGKYTARAFLDDSVLSSCDKETNHDDEYISREAALTALQDSDLFNTTERQLRAIRELPAADVAEVVRCKDCKYYRNHPNGLCYLHTEPKENERGYSGDAVCVEPDDFCSRGVTE